MQCFHHHETPAVGLCKYCGKGLCPACAADLDAGLACRGVHENQVASARSMLERARRTQASLKTMRIANAVFFVCVGAAMVWLGVRYEGGVLDVLSAMGVAFLAYGAFMGRAAMKV